MINKELLTVSQLTCIKTGRTPKPTSINNYASMIIWPINHKNQNTQ